MTQEEHEDTQQASQESCVRSLDNLKGLEGVGDKGYHFFTGYSVRGTAS